MRRSLTPLLLLPALFLPGCAHDTRQSDNTASLSGACLLSAAQASDVLGAPVKPNERDTDCTYLVAGSEILELKLSFVDSPLLPSPSSTLSQVRATRIPHPELGRDVVLEQGVHPVVHHNPAGPPGDHQLVDAGLRVQVGARVVQVVVLEATLVSPEAASTVSERALRAARLLRSQAASPAAATSPAPGGPAS